VEKLYSDIVGTPVFEDDASRPFVSVKGVVLDPEMRGKLIAFLVNVARRRIISPVDVLSWGSVMKVHNRADVTDAVNVLRVDEVLKKGVKFFGAHVETEKGEKLGKVFDLGIDNKTFDLRRIFVAKNLIGIFRYENRKLFPPNILLRFWRIRLL